MTFDLSNLKETYIIRINPKVAPIKGITPALRKITEDIMTPVLEEFSPIITKIPAVIRTKLVMLDIPDTRHGGSRYLLMEKNVKMTHAMRGRLCRKPAR
jgi:hypothetical protein